MAGHVVGGQITDRQSGVELKRQTFDPPFVLPFGSSSTVSELLLLLGVGPPNHPGRSGADEYNTDATIVQPTPRLNMGLNAKPKMGTDSSVPDKMANAAAKHLTILSAYFIVAATRSPPTPLRTTMSHTRISKPWSTP